MQETTVFQENGFYIDVHVNDPVIADTSKSTY